MSRRRPRRFHWAVGASLVALVAIAHGGALRGAFHYDDFHAIVENSALRTWQPTKYFASSHLFSARADGANYRPVTVTSLALNVLVGGMSPAAFLAVNLLLHAAAAWLMYLIGRRLLDDDRWAAVAAGIYAVHPINAEAVNYVVARSSLLATCLALTALLALFRRDEGMRGGLGLAVVAYGLALLSKEAALAVLPPVLCLTWVGRTERREGVPASAVRRWNLPVIGSFLGLSAAFVLLWRWMVGAPAQGTGEGAAYPLWASIEIMVRSVGLWFWPWPLGLDHPVVFAKTFDIALAAVFVGVLGLLAGIMVWSLRRARLIAWLVVWIVSGFLPLLPLPWMTTQALLQENRMSFSAAGLAWLTAWLTRSVWTGFVGRLGGPRVARAVGLGLAAVAVLGAVAVDRSRSWVWNDDARLWEEVVRRRPDDPVAFASLGSVYYVRGALDRAEGAFRRALAADPDYAWAALHLGLIYIQRGQWDPAAAVLANALDRRNRRGAGPSAGEPGPTRDRADDAQKIRMALAFAYLNRGDLSQAQALYEEATRADTADFRAWYNLGAVAEQRGLIEAAREAYQRAFALAPDEAQIAAAVQRLKQEP